MYWRNRSIDSWPMRIALRLPAALTTPDDVNVATRGLRRGHVLEVRVHPDDLGKVIGRGGRTARALRTVIGSLAGRQYVRVDLVDATEVR